MELIVNICQWAYMVMGLISCYLVVKKIRIGWMIWLLSTPIAIFVFIVQGLYPIIVVFIVYGYLDWKGFKEWKENKNENI